MLEVGKYYTGAIEGNSYKCIDIHNDMVTMWVLAELSQEQPLYVERKDGGHEKLQRVSADFTQDIVYQYQYKRITDEHEISRLSQIFDGQHTDHEKNKVHPVPLVRYEITNQQFNAVMEEIDTELKKQKIAIATRAFHAFPMIEKKLNVTDFLITGGDPIPEYFTSHNLGAHIHQWYDIQYGDKMKMDFRIGRMIITITGEAFVVGFPRLYGRAKFICDPSLRKHPLLGVNGPVTINLLASIEGLTKSLAAKITNEELAELAMLYGSTFNAMLNYVSSSLPLQREAMTDMETAVDSFFYKHEQYGQSKWHSLQFAEKLLKSIIASHGKEYPFTHKLKDLANIVYDLSGIKIEKGLLAEIECKPEVRYTAELVSSDDAIKSHHASLALLRSVMDQLPNSRKFGGIKINNERVVNEEKG